MLSNFACGLAMIAIGANAWGEEPMMGSYPMQQWGGWNQQPSYGGWGKQKGGWGSQHSQYQHNPWSGYNHWGQQEPEKPEGWYSPTQQYSPPRIPYVPSKAVYEPIYAVCEFDSTNILELAQLPGHPIYLRGSTTGLSIPEGDTI